MITVNNRSILGLEGMTIAEVISQYYPYAKIYVKCNGHHIEPEDYATIMLAEGDQLQVIHLMAGG